MDPLQKFSWLVSLGKGIRDLVLSAVFAALLTALGTVLGALDAEKLTSFGVPAYLLPVFLALFSSVRNVLRNKLRWPVVIAFLSLGLGQ